MAVFLHDYGETSWEDQVNKESLVERTVRATVHAKRTLMAGFTTVRSVLSSVCATGPLLIPSTPIPPLISKDTDWDTPIPTLNLHLTET